MLKKQHESHQGYKVLIVAPYCSLPGERRFNRFLYIAKLLQAEGISVTLLTSTFSHSSKEFRDQPHKFVKDGINFVLLQETGYKRNLSLKRVLSIRSFQKEFLNWLRNNPDYDLIYSAFPLIGTNVTIAKLKQSGAIRSSLIIDIQDIWPESIVSAVPLMRYLPKWAWPWRRSIKGAFRAASHVVAVSKSYAEWVRELTPEVSCDVVYIGSDFSAPRLTDSTGVEKSGLKLFYIGSLGSSYDLRTPIEGVAELRRRGFNVELHIYGGTAREVERLNKFAKEGVFFHGYIQYNKMIEEISKLDVALNPIRQHAAQSVTNKLSDYLSLGCPILNSQENAEVLNLLQDRLSRTYVSSDPDDFVSAFLELSEDESISRPWRPDPRFQRSSAYQRINDLVRSLLV